MAVWILAITLLVVRVVGAVLLVDVIKKQREKLKLPISEAAKSFRFLIVFMTIVLLVRHLIFAGVDIAALAIYGFDTKINDEIITTYFTTNNVTDLLLSILVWLMYANERSRR